SGRYSVFELLRSKARQRDADVRPQGVDVRAVELLTRNGVDHTQSASTLNDGGLENVVGGMRQISDQEMARLVVGGHFALAGRQVELMHDAQLDAFDGGRDIL